MTQEQQQRQKATKADSIPERRIFMTGNGKPVQPSISQAFCGAIVNALLDGKIASHYEFALGFAACFDAIARGTIDLQANPVDVVNQALADVKNVAVTPNKVTDVMRIGQGR